jgi:hypothetical protein
MLHIVKWFRNTPPRRDMTFFENHVKLELVKKTNFVLKQLAKV